MSRILFPALLASAVAGLLGLLGQSAPDDDRLVRPVDRPRLTRLAGQDGRVPLTGGTAHPSPAASARTGNARPASPAETASAGSGAGPTRHVAVTSHAPSGRPRAAARLDEALQAFRSADTLLRRRLALVAVSRVPGPACTEALGRLALDRSLPPAIRDDALLFLAARPGPRPSFFLSIVARDDTSAALRARAGRLLARRERSRIKRLDDLPG